MNRDTRKNLFIAAAIFLLNVALNAALFLPGETKYRDSIESGYSSMARFFSEHPDPFGWNPYQYFGLPAHMWYLPGVPYLSALCIRLLPLLKPEHVYRLVVTTAACLVPATMFLLAVFFSRNRRWSAAAAVAFTFCSPAYGMFYAIYWDHGIAYLPWRMQVLAKYGEGPHNTGLMLIPLALLALWRAAVGRRRLDLALAAMLLAAVTLTNWIAALALAWCTLLLIAVGSGTTVDTGFRARRLLSAAGIGYLLACFWLTPNFIWVTAFNWPLDAFNYHMEIDQWTLLALLAMFLVLGRLAMVRHRKHFYLIFVGLVCCGFFTIVGAHYWLNADAIPEARRYVPEFEMTLFLFAAEACRLSWRIRNPLFTFVMGAVVWNFVWYIVPPGYSQVWNYPRWSWIMLRPAPRETFIEYQTAKFLADQHPQGRVFVSGGTRFRLNSWFLVPQVGGTFESGLTNRTAVALAYQVRKGLERPPETRALDALNLLRVAGVEYVAIHGPRSTEHWRDVEAPEMFEGVLNRIWTSGDNRIYRVPFPGLANLVKPDELPAKLPTGVNTGLAAPYVAAMDDVKRPQWQAVWQGTSRLLLTGQVPDGYLVTTRVSWDSNWRAEQDGHPLEVSADTMGYILLHPHPAATSRIVLHYAGSRQQYAGTLISLLTAGLLLYWVRQEMKVRSRTLRETKLEAAAPEPVRHGPA